MKEHTLHLASGQSVTLVFQNVMLADVRFRLFARYADENEWPDSNLRSDFAWLVAPLVEVRGDILDFDIPATNASADEFGVAYYALMAAVEVEAFYEAVRAVNALKTRTDPLEKPDNALTPEEEADPNS